MGNVSGGAESNLGSIPTPNRRVSAKQKAAVAQTTTTTPTNAVPAVKPVNAPSLGTGAGIKRGRATETGSPLANEYDYGNDESTLSLLAIFQLLVDYRSRVPASKKSAISENTKYVSKQREISQPAKAVDIRSPNTPFPPGTQATGPNRDRRSPDFFFRSGPKLKQHYRGPAVQKNHQTCN